MQAAAKSLLQPLLATPGVPAAGSQHKMITTVKQKIHKKRKQPANDIEDDTTLADDTIDDVNVR